MIAGSFRSADAQNNALTASAAATQPTKPFTFEVVSIRPHKPGTDGSNRDYLPDGFRGTWNIESLIFMAYTLGTGPMGSVSKVTGGPQWIATDFYDIEARVNPGDLAAWQKYHDVYHSEPLRLGLQAALQDRMKLALHVTSVDQPCLNLVIGKQALKLEPTVPGAIKPVLGKTNAAGEGFYIEDNGKRQFAGVSMEDLALLLTRLNRGHLVQDKTGLTGRYDFTLPVDSSPDVDGAYTSPIDRMPVTSVGLALKLGTAPFYNINIDHIERPDAN